MSSPNNQTELQARRAFSPLMGISYALPVVPLMILMSSNNVLSGVYAKYHGLSLASISMVMLIAGLFDTITDPTIGYLSDRHHRKTGSRRPFVILGALALVPTAWLLLNPPEGVTATYFLVWYMAFYLAITLVQIPHLTWGGEVCTESTEKAKVYGYRNYGHYGGMILFALVPMMPWSEGSKVTPETMRYLVLVAGVILLPTLYMLVRYVPISQVTPGNTTIVENPWRATLALLSNKPLMWLLLVTLSYILGLAFFNGLKFMVMDSYLELGQYYAPLILFHLVVATLAIKPSVAVIQKVGNIKALSISLGLALFAFLCFPLVLLKSAYSLHYFIWFDFVFSLASAIFMVALYALLSDISDYGTWKFRVDRSAACFSLHSLSSKTSLTIGISLSIGLAGLFGFDPALETQDEQVFLGLLVCMCIIPVALSLLALVCVPKIGITARRHAIIRKRLDARIERAERDQARTLPGKEPGDKLDEEPVSLETQA